MPVENPNPLSTIRTLADERETALSHQDKKYTFITTGKRQFSDKENAIIGIYGTNSRIAACFHIIRHHFTEIFLSWNKPIKELRDGTPAKDLLRNHIYHKECDIQAALSSESNFIPNEANKNLFKMYQGQSTRGLLYFVLLLEIRALKFLVL